MIFNTKFYLLCKMRSFKYSCPLPRALHACVSVCEQLFTVELELGHTVHTKNRTSVYTGVRTQSSYVSAHTPCYCQGETALYNTGKA